MDEGTHERAILAARQVARAASLLASEAASLARVYEAYGADASVDASEAAVRAAEAAFALDAQMLRGRASQASALDGALHASLASLEAAAAAVQSTRAALGAASAAAGHARAGESDA